MLAVIAIAVGIGAWFKPAPKPEAPAAKTYSEQEVADAKKAACDAFTNAHDMLVSNSKRGGTNPTEVLIAGVNTRLAVLTAGSYIDAALNQNPALASDLAEKLRQLSSTYMTIAVDQLGETSQEKLDEIYQDAETNAKAISEACT
ncbi:hypothetical protein [Mycobacterium sp. M26]|uniref:hypothetical protein n=1 Tax=Mycobacterium sp. M26 TaxID=1762962 RepID=UPI00073E2E0C|nr:hypothetical protein [Mycobacterium sp. M26]